MRFPPKIIFYLFVIFLAAVGCQTETKIHQTKVDVLNSVFEHYKSFNDSIAVRYTSYEYKNEDLQHITSIGRGNSGDSYYIYAIYTCR